VFKNQIQHSKMQIVMCICFFCTPTLSSGFRRESGLPRTNWTGETQTRKTTKFGRGRGGRLSTDQGGIGVWPIASVWMDAEWISVKVKDL